MNRFKKVTQNGNLPILIILLIGIIVGVFIFTDYGASLDEPEYYQYADSTIQAYSVRALINHQYSLESSLGTGDLRYYGPSFLILGKGILPILSFLFPDAQNIDLWHFWIYIFFLLGGFFFYKLAFRWTSLKPAIISTLLFISQPVLFGNAWIDPKDIPLLVFFLGTIYFGLLFKDRYELFLGEWKECTPQINKTINPWFSFKGKWHKAYLIIGGVLILLCSSMQIWSNLIKKRIAELIASVNVASPTTLFDKIFVAQVKAIGEVPLSYYSQKSAILYDRLLLVFEIGTLGLCILLILIHRYPRILINLWTKLKHAVIHFRRYYRTQPHKAKLILSFVGTCLFLACSSATRVIGPLAGILVLMIWIIDFKKNSIRLIPFYGLFTFILFFIQWPYIWEQTFKRLTFVLQHMSNNPVGVNVLFAGTTYDSRYLPATYMPGLLGVTLTEPALVLIIVGLGLLIFKFIANKFRNHEWLVLLGWICIPLGYILIKRPPMYDNYRHFLFIIPALFILTAFSIQSIFNKISNRWLQAIISLIILIPGLIALYQMHPFEYSYYNRFVGGIKGAENQYELDYWLTCYKNLGEMAETNEPNQVNVYSDLSHDIVSLYQYPKLIINSIRSEPFAKGGLIFLPKRWGHDTLYDQYPIVYSVKIQGVSLCIARRVQ